MALLLVVGVLGILGALSVAFVSLARLERTASLQRTHSIKSQLLARSGLEDAIARIGSGQDPDLTGTRYLGEDWNNSGFLNGIEVPAEVYRPTGVGTIPDRELCPVRHALRPSFFARQKPTVNPRLARVDGRQRGFSGLFGGPDLQYSLRVVPQEGIHVNGGDPSASFLAGYNGVLRRILGTLAEAVDREDGVNDGLPVNQTDGEALLGARPPGGWRDWDQVRALALGGSLAKLDALRPYLALEAWVDLRVIRPNAGFALNGAYWNAWADLKLAHQTYAAPLRRAPDFERIPASPAGRVVGRAPVSLAWARTRRPVLIALMASVAGIYLDENSPNANAFASDDRIGRTLQTGLTLSTWTTSDACITAVDALMACTADLATWQEWDAFCDTVPFTSTGTALKAQRDLLKANFNPNSNLNKFNPNPSLWRTVDKMDLTTYSTEFSLVPGMRGLEISAVGRVLSPTGRLLALREASATLAGPKAVRISTQREFMASDLGSLELAGDEGAARRPAQAFTTSGAPGVRTWGHTLAGSGGNGFGLQSYPEPVVRPAASLVLNAADFDGSLMLATLETAANDAYNAGAGPNDMKMLARFDVDLDLDVHDAAASANVPDLQQVSTAELGNSVLDPLKVNTLYPDGCYSERDRAPAYPDRGNAHGFHGVFSFWVKPSYALGVIPALWRGRRLLQWTNFTRDALGGYSEDSQFFAIVNGYTTSLDNNQFSAQMEITHSSSDSDLEFKFVASPMPSSPRRWRLVTMAYDLQGATKHAMAELLVDAGSAVAGPYLACNDIYSVGANPALAMDITRDDQGASAVPGPHHLVLGMRRSFPWEYTGVAAIGTFFGGGADATFDEFAVYDFGAGYPDVLARQFAATRYAEGRYYKESGYGGLAASPGTNTAGRWYSAPIDLGGARLLALSWTQVVPPGLRSPADPGPDGGVRFELTDDTGVAYAQDASASPIDALLSDPVRSPLGRVAGGPFRLHAVFQPELSATAMTDTPVLDPLALDDVTLLWEPAAGRALLSWGGAS